MKKIGVISFIAIFIAACNKDFSSSTFTAYNNLNINDTAWMGSGASSVLHDSIANTLDTLGIMVDSFDCSTGKNIKFNNNEDLQANFPPMCGNSGSGGSTMIRAELLVLKKKGDFIRVLAHTKNIDKPLDASYCFYIRLSNRAGQEIGMPSGINYTLSWKDANADNRMSFYEGLQTNNSDTLMNWVPSMRGNIHQSFQPGSQTNIKGYELISGTTHWVGGLKYTDTTAGTTTVHINFNSLNFTNKNTIAYVVLKDSKSVIRMASDSVSKTFYSNRIPIGARVTIVTISWIDKQFFLGTNEVTTNTSNIYKIVPDKKTVNDIHTYLDNL